MTKLLFHQIVVELVDRERRIRSEKRELLAFKLNCSESYLRKIHSYSTDKHYSLEHLYILSLHWNIEISKLVPTVENLKLLPAYQDYSESKLKEIIQKVQKSIMEGYYE